VAPLPQSDPAQGLSATASLLAAELDGRLQELGVTRAELDAVDSLDDPLIPLAIAQRMIDHPDNPNSLRAILDGSAPDVVLDARTRDFIDRVLTAQANTSEDTLRTLGSELLVDCGAGLTGITTADQLSCWMTLSNDANDYLASPTATRIRAAIGILIGVAGVFTGGSGAVAGGILWFVLNQIVDGVIGMAPSELTNLDVRISDDRLCNEGEQGRITSVQVSARSRGWTITLATIIDGMLSFAGAGFVRSGFAVAGGRIIASETVIARLGANATESISEGASQVIQIVNTVLVNTAGLAPGGAGDLIKIDPRTIGPVPLELTTDYTLTNPDGLLTLSGLSYARSASTGHAGLMFRTKAERFGNSVLQRNVTVVADEFRIDIAPVLSKPEGEVILEAEVHCYEGMDTPQIGWGTLGTQGGRFITREQGIYQAPTCSDRYCGFTGEVSAELLNANAPSTRFSQNVVVTDCCDPEVPLNCTRQERCACDPQPDICTGEIAIGGETCISPGSSTRLRVFSDFGDNPEDIVWTVQADGGSAGTIVNGLFTAPEYAALVVVRAASAADPSNAAVLQIQVLNTCNNWVITGAGQRFDGALVIAPVAAVPNGEAYPLTLGQGDGVSQPMGSIAILNHPGRDSNCVGPTGTFSGSFGVGDATGFLGAEDITMRVVRLDPVVTEIRFSGVGIYSSSRNEEDTPAVVSGSITLPGSGCLGQTTDEPGPIGNGGDILGSINADGLCIEILEGGGLTREVFAEQVCDPDPECMTGERCPAGAVLVCDASGGGSAAMFPQILHFYASDYSLAEAQMSCRAFGGQPVP